GYPSTSAISRPESGARHIPCPTERGEARDRSDAIAALNRVEPLLVLRQVRPVVLGMPQMEDAGCEIAVLSAHASAQQTDQQVGIPKAPAAVGRIETVDVIEIAPPHREIAGSRAPPGLGPELAQRAERQRQHRRQPVDLALAAQADPFRQAEQLDLAPFRQRPLGEFARHQDTIAGHEPTRLGKAAVHGNEVGPRNAIAVEEDAIIPAARQDGAVARLAGPEAAILLPDVLERSIKVREPALDKLARRWP